MSGTDENERLRRAGELVIQAADQCYGTQWRDWPRRGASSGARNLSTALSTLEAALIPTPEDTP